MLGIPELAESIPSLGRFALLLMMVAIAPFLARRARVPDCVGYIMVGVIAGPHLLGIAPHHAQVADFFANLGKLLLMFFVGLEIDMRQFNQHRNRAAGFGLLTFALPMAAGTAVGIVFGYSMVSALLIGSLLASHTLIAFPIVSAAGLTNRPSVTVTAGATVLTDMLSLLVLAACLSAHRSGFDPAALARQVAELVAFAALMVFVLPIPARAIERRLGSNEEARFIVLLMVVCIAATLAEAIDLEGIIGAFLAGLAVNRATVGTEARHRLEFVGRALFIPAFFVVTGYLVDLVVLGRTLVQGLPMVVAVVGGLVASKWAAAEIAGRAWRMGGDDRLLMASLTMPQVAATLAAALVGYDAVNAAGERLLDQAMLNTVLVLVVATSVLGPILTERAVRRIKDAPAG
ncbi:cation:proton antiporter [Roseomonas sp. CECT 9278]|uniref:cation:proton antiporter n=1 Tax=Roseomonas sp. CECT 9278 TaxID=2845823 RepID=UPI001E42D76C|nr:cation:proton antiporter [Roseomonas sp. CECT 9278]CAH0305427.1 Na(+)/H(+)-K(+) antiporter GerN [Roseomonas sp. CECT 9278]